MDNLVRTWKRLLKISEDTYTYKFMDELEYDSDPEDSNSNNNNSIQNQYHKYANRLLKAHNVGQVLDLHTQQMQLLQTLAGDSLAKTNLLPPRSTDVSLTIWYAAECFQEYLDHHLTLQPDPTNCLVADYKQVLFELELAEKHGSGGINQPWRSFLPSSTTQDNGSGRANWPAEAHAARFVYRVLDHLHGLGVSIDGPATLASAPFGTSPPRSPSPLQAAYDAHAGDAYQGPPIRGNSPTILAVWELLSRMHVAFQGGDWAGEGEGEEDGDVSMSGV